MVWFIFIYALVAGGREMVANLKTWERKYVLIHGFVLVLVAIAIVIGFLFFLDELPKLAPFLALLAVPFIYLVVRYDKESPGQGEKPDDRHQ